MPDTPDRPSIAEIADLTSRLRTLSTAGRNADPAERARFLADKQALLDRITAADQTAADTSSKGDVSGDAQRYDRIVAASWAIAARDAAIERSDPVATQRFAAEAAETIAAAQRAGISLAELAYELDYPGGIDEMLGGGSLGPARGDDGAPRDDAATRGRVGGTSAHEAGDDGRVLHQHSAIENRGDGADPWPALSADATRYAEHLDPWAPGWTGDPWAGYRIYSCDEAAAELVNRGVPADQAPGVVERYLDSWEGCWPPENEWQIDDADLDAMAAPPPVGVEMARTEGDVPAFGPTDDELDAMHANVQAAREEGRFWQPSGVREQWRERDEPSVDGRRWELRDVTDEPADVADRYGSTYGSGYDWAAREFDPTAEQGMTGAEGYPIPGGPVWSAADAARVLSEADGRPLEQAQADVARYLDDTSERLGTRMHDWGLDDADLASLAMTPATEQPPDCRGGGRLPSCLGYPEDERREQLQRWHEADQADAAVRDDADGAELGRDDGEVSS